MVAQPTPVLAILFPRLAFRHNPGRPQFGPLNAERSLKSKIPSHGAAAEGMRVRGAKVGQRDLRDKATSFVSSMPARPPRGI